MYIQYKICICNIMIYQYTIDKYIQIYLYDAPPVVETRCGLGSAVIGPRVKFLLIYVYMYELASITPQFIYTYPPYTSYIKS